MRLIDADALIEKMAISRHHHASCSRENELLYRAEAIVREQPTAYDVEAVVAELEKTKNECEPMYGGRRCGKEAKAIYAMALSYAISIVRGKE